MSTLFMQAPGAASDPVSARDQHVPAVIDLHRSWKSASERVGEARLAHAIEWSTAIPRAYGHEPLYLTAGDGERHVGLLPAFVVHRPLAGTVVASMPFLDGGGPCSTSPYLSDLLFERLILEARRRHAMFVDIRCDRPLPTSVPAAGNKVAMRLRLPRHADVLWTRFDTSVRNQVRKAERSGLSIEFGGEEALDSFYQVFVERMHDLGSPVHDRRFFAAILDGFGSRARVALVKKGRTTVGGLVALAFKGELAVPWAACSKEHFPLCPNMLLYWELIRTACADGFSQFDFGRSTRQSGTYRFKRQWGAQEEPLFWYRIPIASRTLKPARDGSAGGLATRIWRHLPVAVTRRLWPRIRKHLIQ